MSRRLDLAKAYEKALFAGNRTETGSYFTDDIVYWVAGARPIGGEWRGREAVLDALGTTRTATFTRVLEGSPGRVAQVQAALACPV